MAGVLSCAADNAMNLQFHVQVTGINLEWLDLIANLLNNAFFSLLRTHAMSEDILLITSFPEFCVNGEKLQFVESFKYLGHIISNSNIDDADIQREVSNMFIRTNILARVQLQ